MRDDAGARRESACRDSGLACFVLIARFHGTAADAAHLSHEFLSGDAPFGTFEMLRAARRLGLKARERAATWEDLANLTLPALAIDREGGFIVLARVAADRVLAHDAVLNRPLALTREE